MPRSSRNPAPDDDLPDLFAAVPATGAARRHFLGWEASLVGAVVDHLAAGWDEKGALDLTDSLVLVPTRNASRRLREALALRAAECDAAVLPPLVVTPDFLTSPERVPEVPVAGRVETLLIWAGELLKLDLDQHRQLFPTDPVDRTFSWALKVAGDLLELRETLNEKGLSLADAARILAGSEMEPERWDDLARVEKQCLRATEDRNLADWQTTRRRAAAQGEPPEGVTRIVLAGVLDPSGLAIEVLQRWSRSIPVEVLVHAPESTHGAAFDEWGRPVAEAWLERMIDIPSPERTIHSGRTPEEQAGEAVEILSGYEKPGGVAAIGVADTEVNAPLEKALGERGIGAFDPAGQRMGTHGVFHLLGTVADLAKTRSFASAAELLRCADVADAVSRQVEATTGQWPSLSHLLNDLDTLAAEALPDTLDDAIELAPNVFSNPDQPSPVPAALAWVDGALRGLEGPNFGESLTEFLGEVFASRKFRSDNPQDAVFAAIADQIIGTLDALDGPASGGFPGGIDAAYRLELLLLVLADQVFYTERQSGDIDLQGWLELLWEDAPHLVITGMNDGKAPESILGHTFLPDSARRALGLRNNDTRFARDACLMTTLIESRRHTKGRVDFVFGRVSGSGDPLRPSRLLLQCGPEKLPARTLQLFEAPVTGEAPMPWSLAWKLRPRPLPDDARIFRTLSVTSFASYLRCPFRFYLGHGLEMTEIDVAPTEMNAMSYGNLIHGVLENFARNAEMAALSDMHAIRETFHKLLDQRLHGTYGPRLTVPVMIQRESARQRLAWWAEIEAEQRRQGWQIEAAETYLSPKEEPWTLGGVTIRGKIDRIERHPQLGLRLIDFKTSSYSTSERDEKIVRDYHTTAIKKSEDPDSFPAWAIVDAEADKPLRWINLQLPLYRLAMEHRHSGEAITTALVSLGRTQGDVGIHAWTGLDDALLKSARACAEGVIAAIQARRFWPPAEGLRYDDFEHLFFGEPLEAVDPSLLTGKEAA